MIASALRLANVTSDVINIITGALLVLSVVSTSFLAWLQRMRITDAVGRLAPPSSNRLLADMGALAALGTAAA